MSIFGFLRVILEEFKMVTNSLNSFFISDTLSESSTSIDQDNESLYIRCAVM